MRIQELLIESQTDEGVLGSIARGIGTGAGAVAKGAGAVSGAFKGMKDQFQKGQAAGRAHVGGWNAPTPKDTSVRDQAFKQQTGQNWDNGQKAPAQGQPAAQAQQPAQAQGGAPAQQPAQAAPQAQAAPAQQQTAPQQQAAGVSPAKAKATVGQINKMLSGLAPKDLQKVKAAADKVLATKAATKKPAQAPAQPAGQPNLQVQQGGQAPTGTQESVGYYSKFLGKGI